MNNQKGAALLVVLSMLTMSLILGLSGMQSSLIDERLAGNYRASSVAQMNAEAGVAEGLEKFSQEWVSGLSGESLISIFDKYRPNESVNDFPYEGMLSNSYEIFPTLESLYGLQVENCGGGAFCYYSYIMIKEGESIPSGLYVWSIGYNDESGLAKSAPLLVRLNVGASSFRDLMPITISSGLYNFEAPSGNQFRVSREEEDNIGPSIAVSHSSEIQEVKDSVGKRLDNYVSEDGEFVVAKNDYDIFSNPVDLQTFVERIKSLGSSVVSDQLGTPGDPKITYIDGDYSYSESSDKGGVLVVDGDFTWNGNNAYEGIIIVLGQTFTYNGGGQSSIRGSLVHAAIDGGTRCEGCDWQFGVGSSVEGAEALLNGGGDSAFVHSNEVLDKVAGIIPPSVTEGLINQENLIKVSDPTIGLWLSA